MVMSVLIARLWQCMVYIPETMRAANVPADQLN